VELVVVQAVEVNFLTTTQITPFFQVVVPKRAISANCVIPFVDNGFY
jgi:hypothetical protein